MQMETNIAHARDRARVGGRSGQAGRVVQVQLGLPVTVWKPWASYIYIYIHKFIFNVEKCSNGSKISRNILAPNELKKYLSVSSKYILFFENRKIIEIKLLESSTIYINMIQTCFER
jgi:hypothetical protein